MSSVELMVQFSDTHVYKSWLQTVTIGMHTFVVPLVNELVEIVSLHSGFFTLTSCHVTIS